MQMMKFDCPPDLAKRFWVMCRARNVTSGQMLRVIMAHEIQKWELEYPNQPQKAQGSG